MASGNEKSGLEATLTAAPHRRNGGKGGHSHFGEDGPHEHSNDHFASIYEGQEDQFESIIPFIQQGLEQGERCLYIADDNAEEEVLKALRKGGIDVGTALDAGMLSIYTKANTYLRGGEFETEAMVEFWQEVLAEAKGENGYAGVRAAAEMTWALDEGTDLDQLVQYEALLNTLFSGEDYVVLCQYNRERFSEEVLSDVIRSHPFVVYNGTVCENLHYHPPEEFFDSDRPPLDVGRTVEGLLRRAETRQTLRERERFQRTLYQITSDPDRSFEEKLDALFDLGCEYFGLELGGLARIDPTADLFEVECTSDSHKSLAPGKEYPLSETYCRITADKRGTAAVSDPVERGFEGALCYEQFGVRAYLGTLIELDGTLDRIFFFVSTEPKEGLFTEAEKTFHHLMGQWIEQELRKKQREEALKDLNETLEARVEKRTRQVRKLTAKVTLAEQRERDRVARLLHDGLQQKLYGSQLQISSLRKEAQGAGQEELASQIQKVEGEVEEIIQAMRQLSVGMSPPVLGSDGLKGALEWLQSHLEETQGLEVDLTAEREFRVEEEMRVLLFRATREILMTLAECPHTSQAAVELRGEEGDLVIEVRGDGMGFDAETVKRQDPEKEFGLTVACERLRIFGGELKLNAGSAEDSRAEIRVPVEGSH